MKKLITAVFNDGHSFEMPWAPVMIIWVVLLYGCEINNDRGGSTGLTLDSKWLVPEHEVIDGGPGQDGIPSIDDPKFAPVDQIDFIPDERRVLGMKIGDEIRAYPHQILDWHEVVNERFGDRNIAVTYCPLTGTGIAWRPRMGAEYGTSGLIFRNNLVAYDRNSESLWSQMRLRAINGPRMDENLDMVYLIETKWSTWKSMYPNSQVLTTDTGYNRDYQSYAYGEDYAEKDGILLFPTKYRQDNRLNRKARVHAIIADDTLHENSTVRVYEISKFGSNIEVIHDQLGGESYVVVGSTSLDFAAAYRTTLRDGTQLSFEPIQNQLPVVMKDQESNRWNIFGEAVEGPRAGQRLDPAKSYTGYWFGMRDIFRLPEIYQFENQ